MGNYIVIKWLIRNVSDKNQIFPDGCCPIYYAYDYFYKCKNGRFLEDLFKIGADLEIKYKNGSNAFQVAVVKEKSQHDLYLFLNSSKPKQFIDVSPYFINNMAHNFELSLFTMLNSDFDKNIIYDNAPFWLSIINCNHRNFRREDEWLFETLLKNITNINLQTEDGWNILHYAASNNYDIRIIKLLIKYGADIRIKDKNGKTPADYVDNSRGARILELLKHD